MKMEIPTHTGRDINKALEIIEAQALEIRELQAVIVRLREERVADMIDGDIELEKNNG